MNIAKRVSCVERKDTVGVELHETNLNQLESDTRREGIHRSDPTHYQIPPNCRAESHTVNHARTCGPHSRYILDILGRTANGFACL